VRLLAAAGIAQSSQSAKSGSGLPSEALPCGPAEGVDIVDAVVGVPDTSSAVVLMQKLNEGPKDGASDAVARPGVAQPSKVEGLGGRVAARLLGHVVQSSMVVRSDIGTREESGVRRVRGALREMLQGVSARARSTPTNRKNGAGVSF
jgi:hypothetical protein